LDKANQAERLGMKVEAVRKKSLEYEELISLAKQAAEDARRQADFRTSQLSAENVQLSMAIDTINNDIASLRDQLQRSQEHNARLASVSKDLKSQVQIAQDGASTNAENVKSLEDEVQRRTEEAKELQSTVDSKEASLDEARYELRQAGARVDYQKGRIAQLENEVVAAQQQLRERQRIERRLLSQLEVGAVDGDHTAARTQDEAELAAVSPRGLRERLKDSEAHRTELSQRLLEILRRETNGPEVP
jgi:chromosome segregation ATPase